MAVARAGDPPAPVVGVAPPGFEFPERAELWVPIAPLAAGEPRSERGVGVVGRLPPGATLVEAAAEVRARAAPRRRAPRDERRLRSALVVSQIAGAMVLLTGAGLLCKTLLRTIRTDLGYSTENLLGADLLLLGARYEEPAQRALLQERLLERVRALPGVRSAALSTPFILNWPGVSERGIAVEGVSQELADAAAGRAHAVSPEYFTMLGLQVLQGRAFTAQDRQGTPQVAVMNEAMARRLWPDGDAVGKRIKLGGPASASPWITIVGVVANMRFSPVGGSQFPPYLYLPYAQHPMPRPAGLDVVQLVLRDGLRLTTVGIGLGIAGALLLTRVLRVLRFGVSATDPLVFAAVAVLLGAVALLASLLPARAAARVDPIIALRAK